MEIGGGTEVDLIEREIVENVPSFMLEGNKQERFRSFDATIVQLQCECLTCLINKFSIKHNRKRSVAFDA